MEYNELEEYEEYDEYYDELEEYEEEQEISLDEESTKVINGQVKYKCVNNSERAEKYGRISDGYVTKYANYALEYFGYRCALSGEKFYNFNGKVNETYTTNLSAEHVIALTIGGHDIVPNIVPTVLQYNVQKNGYYILDWWEKQKDINGKDIYSPYRLLKLVNFMMKSIEGRGLSARKYHELLMKPNEIDKYLEKIEKQDLEETDNSKRKILSDTETTITIDKDNKKILTKIPLAEGNIINQAEDSIKRKEYDEKEMMDTFLIDAVRIIQKEKDIAKEEIETENGNKITIEEKLEEMLSKTIGEIPFEANVRNKILEQLEEVGIENNKYTVVNVIFKNTNILEKYRKSEEINIKETIQTRMENILPQINQEQKKELISVMPDLLYDDNAVKEYEDNLKWYSEYKNVNIDEINPILFTKAYFINAIKIKKWMEEHNTTKPPTRRRKDEFEKSLGILLGSIRNQLIKPYDELETDEEKIEYIKKHPELEEVMQIVEEIDSNNIPKKEDSLHHIKILEIKKWMQVNNTTKPPSQHSEDEMEKSLGRVFSYIKQRLIKPYNELETDEEKIEYRKKHPELEEVIQIVEEIDRNNIAQKEDSSHYKNILKIREWMKDNNTIKPPRATISINNKHLSKKEQTTEQQTEVELGRAWIDIQRRLIKPYNELETDEEKIEYRKKHPEFEEVMQIVEEIKKNNIKIKLKEETTHYINAIRIKEWMKEHNTTKAPRCYICVNGKILKNEEITAEQKEESKLGRALQNIKSQLIKPYNELETDEEKIEYRKKHPEFEEVLRIVEEIDRNNIHVRKKLKVKEDASYYKNILKIKEWMEENNTTNFPSKKSKNDEERRLGNALSTIKQKLIKPYNELETDEEKEQYKKENPGLEEVIQIIEEIDRNNIHVRKKLKVKEDASYYKNILKIKEWMEHNNTTKPPSQQSKNDEERKLGNALSAIKQKLLRPYNELETDEEKIEYRKKHPGLEEVIQIVEEIESNNIPKKENSIHYKNILKIKKWMQDNNTTTPPRAVIYLNNKKLRTEELNIEEQEEIKLGSRLARIRNSLITPYNELETKKEKEQYKEEHPELEEVMQIVGEIDRNNIKIKLKEESAHYINAIKIKEWMKEHSTTQIPRSTIMKNGNKIKIEEMTLEENIEYELGNALRRIKTRLIEPYKKISNEGEKEQYKEEHPELEEVMQIVEEIDRNNPRKVLKKVKEVIVENKQELHENIEISDKFNETIKEIENKQQNYEVLS